MTTLCGCSDDSNNPMDTENNFEAPAQASGEFKFYKNDNFKWSFKVQPSNDPNKALIIVNSSAVRVDKPGNFYYKKIGKRQAEVSCFFTTIMQMAGYQTGQWNQYEITLTFLSDHYGSFSGKSMSNPEDKGSAISGMFTYDTDLELEDILDQYEEDDSDEDVDWSCLAKYDWKRELTSDVWYKYSFMNDGKYEYTFNYISVLKESGTYTIDKNKSQISLKAGNEITVLKVLKLNGNEFIMHNIEVPEDYATTYIAIDKNNEDNTEFNISDPIVENITNSSATIKGTILGDVSFQERGIVYGFDPNPTVNDKKRVSNKNVVNEILTLESGSKYYVRLYAKVNNQVYYGKETSFTTQGNKITNFTATQTYWSDDKVNFTIEAPALATKYGICYAMHSKPEITDKYVSEVKYDSEVNHTDEWSLSGLDRGKTYYVRPYHIEAGKVVYYDEFSISTLGVEKDITIDLSYSSYTTEGSGSWWGTINNWQLKTSWKGLTNGTYKLVAYWSSYGSYNQFNPAAEYISEQDGDKKYFQASVNIYDNVSSRTEMNYSGYVAVVDLDNKIIMQSYFSLILGRYYDGKGKKYLTFLPYYRSSGFIYFDPLR